MLSNFTSKQSLKNREAQELSFDNELFSRLNISSLVSLWNIQIRWTLEELLERVPRPDL